MSNPLNHLDHRVSVTRYERGADVKHWLYCEDCEQTVTLEPWHVEELDLDLASAPPIVRTGHLRKR